MNLFLPDNLRGLSSQEASKRLESEGYNELPTEKKRRLLMIIGDILKEPMILLLLACVTIYLISGDKKESLVLAFSIFIIIFITIYQENKTEKALSALKSLASPRALVWRDGSYLQIAGREVVRGDLIFLKEGDRVPADGVLLWNQGLMVDESLLTGESVPVHKTLGKKDLKMLEPQGENSPFVYSGTMVVSGQALFTVKAIGRQTEMGRIGKILDEVERENTPLQNDLHHLVRYVLVVAIILCLAVIGLNFLAGRGFLPSFLSGLTLAMSILPEEFPVVLAIFLSIGAWHLSHHQILVRKLSMVESLGAVTMLCVDKTGTITMNQMKLESVFLSSADKMIDLSKDRADLPALAESEAFRLIIKAGSLSSRRDTFDPLEKAIKLVRRQLFHEDIYKGLELKQDFPLSSDFLVMTNLWQEKGNLSAYAKGAPEDIFKLSHLKEEELKSYQLIIKKMARSGLRVLGVAHAKEAQNNGGIHDFKWQFLGLFGFMDPVRPTVAEAIKECYRAGIQVKMITGDYPETARTIAGQIGLANYKTVLSGEDFAQLNDKALARKINESNVFARMMPEHKLKIIDALQAAGHIVAMTGDGVNDGPALKSADIGVSMGARGTDVAREASGIVLLDDHFSSLVSGVKEGRRIFDNLQRAIVYSVAIHLPIAILALVPIILGWPLLFFPVHIMFLELIIDPVCSLVFEAEKPADSLMSRPPRDSHRSLLNRGNLLISFVQGFSIALIVLLVYYFTIRLSWGASETRAAAFSALIFANIFLILVNRSWSESLLTTLFNKNRFLWPIISLALICLFLAVYRPSVASIFSFEPFGFSHWTWIASLALVPALIFEIFKFFKRKL
ncbi:MAG: cation-translocating P-type ATPase [Patescibacteria group bacterium]